MKGRMDLWWIKSVLLQDPTIAACIPTSIENPALAYDEGNDRFKVDIQAMSVGTVDANVTDRAARLLGVVYGSVDKLQQRASTKELIVQIQHQGVEKDPTQIRALTNSDAVSVYGSETQKLLQRASTYDLIVQLRSAGNQIDPRSIRALTTSDAITAYGNLDKLVQRATTKELIVQIQHQGAEKDPTQIRALTSSDVVTVADIAKTATEVQIDNTWAGAGNDTVHSPAGTNKVRLKLISLELSADVDLGWRWTTTGTIHYLRTTAGPLVTNFIGCNPEGGASEDLELYASGVCTVKGYCLLEEIA